MAAFIIRLEGLDSICNHLTSTRNDNVSTKEKTSPPTKREEFLTRIRELAEMQSEDKEKFRQIKHTQPWSEERDVELGRQRLGIVRLKSVIRYTLLAYAMFRFQPYAKVEQKCNDKAKAYLIYVAFQRLGLGQVVDNDLITHWLSGGTLLPRK